MKKVIVIGCPGSGKSTFARGLHNALGLPLIYLDMLYWNADRTTVPKEVFRERLVGAMEGESWIIDGNYGSTMELRLTQCDTVFFLDYSLETCLSGIESRKGKPREDMPWVEAEDENNGEFIGFICNFNEKSRPSVLELLNKYSDKHIVIFKNRAEADEYLKRLGE